MNQGFKTAQATVVALQGWIGGLATDITRLCMLAFPAIYTLIGGMAKLCHRVQAKKRVFEIQQARTGAPKIGKRKRELREDIAMASRSNEAVEVVPNLEPLPKWALVQNILEVRILPRSAHVCTGSGDVSGSL